jgi:hypothetical protein
MRRPARRAWLAAVLGMALACAAPSLAAQQQAQPEPARNDAQPAPREVELVEPTAPPDAGTPATQDGPLQVVAPQAAPTPGPAPAAPAQQPKPRPPGPPVSLVVPEAPLRLGQKTEIVVRGLGPSARVAAASLAEGIELDPEATRDADGDVHLKLRVTHEGNLPLELTVVRGDERETLPGVTLRVVLDVPPGQEPKVADALPPVAVPVPDSPIWPFAAGGALALLLIGAWVVRAGRVVVVPAPPPRPADVLAAEELARLRGRLPRTREEVPAFTVDVSSVLRTYVERRFGLRAPESTTEEFLHEAGARAELAGHKEPLAHFLSLCDLVKFARHRPDPSAVVPLLDTAEGFVERTRA